MRLRTLIALAPLALVALPDTSAAADVSQPIRPNQYFGGVVNGKQADATILMGCVGPIVPGQTGHPLAGQTLTVIPKSTIGSGADVGYTGSAGTAVSASPTTTSMSTKPVVFTVYNHAQQLSTDWVLPCSGTGSVSFVPQPTSGSARTATVTVTFVSQP